MTSVVETHPIHYLTPPVPGFWRWEQGSVVFASGETLTFREELLQLIVSLQPMGLPPMESLLLFLAASRDPWSGSLLGAWKASMRELDEEWLARLLPDRWLDTVSRELAKVHGLSPSWRRSLRHKGVVAEVCFEDSETLSTPAHAQAVVNLLEMGFVPPEPTPTCDAEEAARGFVVGIRPLLEGFPELEEARLDTRMRTGLDAVPGKAALAEQALATQVRSLLDALEGDPEWAGLARLARHLMASVHVPRALGDLEELPLGGFSDLTNRGSLDRLLVSELAQDDLVLSAKLALNEALFLRRESPPKTPQMRRVLLLDNGIRLWGIPRLFAAAVALAMEAMTDRGTRVDVYVPVENQQLCQVTLHTYEGLVQALSPLHPHAHPGNALLELVRRVGEQKRAGEAEIFLLTHEDVLSDPAFRSVIDLLQESFFVGTVNREGRYRLHHVHPLGTRQLKEARLSLDAVMGGERDAAALRRTRVPVHLPSIFHEHPFPIRLPVRVMRDRTVFTCGDGIFKTTRDGRLLHFDDQERGGIQLCDHLPSGHAVPVVEVQGLADGRRVTATWEKRLLQVNLVHTGSGLFDTVRIAVKQPPIQLVIVHQQCLVVHQRRLTMHALDSGTAFAEEALPGRVERCFGDLLLIGAEWRRASIDGMRPVLERIDQDRVLESSQMEEYRLKSIGALRKHFRGIAVKGSKIILFPRRAGACLTLRYTQDAQVICLQWYETDAPMVRFREIAGPEGSRLRLQEASWDDGSRVILDSRGLLHFDSASPEVDEFTIILSDQAPVSAWLGASEGGMGDPYFFEDPPVVSAERVQALLTAFALHVEGARC